MKTQFFKPNWSAINKAINEENLKELRKAEKELREKIQNKVDAFYKAKREAEQLKKVAELKALPISTRVYYIGRYENDKIKFGTEFIKVSDGRTRMHINLNGQFFNGPYNSLRKEPPTEQEYRDHKLGKEISRIFNKAINV